jgi:alpha-mannosidase
MQFHDILPGSSVNEVYEEEMKPWHARIAERAEGITADAAAQLAAAIDTSLFNAPVILFNTLGWDRRDPVAMPGGRVLEGVCVPAGGWTAVEAGAQTETKPEDAVTAAEGGRLLQNRFWRVRLNPSGQIAELYDRLRERQVLAPGAVANDLQVFEDRPIDCDAWNIEHYYQEHPLPGPELKSLKLVECSPSRAAVELAWIFPQIGEGPASTLTQRMILHAHTPRIDFETVTDWHDHHQLLKAAFPVDVRAAEASFQIQYGHLRRPTHNNTSWDQARYEVCAHQFADLSEHGYGVALLNDCKYGHDVEGGTLRLTLLKSAQSPDFLADQGGHEFVYSLLPHAGGLQEGGVVRAAAELNNPVLAVPAAPHRGALPADWRLMEVTPEAVVVDWLKPAEDGEGWIVRLYEAHGSRVRARLVFGLEISGIQAVNLLEEPADNPASLKHEGREAAFDLRPFQVMSLRVKTR